MKKRILIFPCGSEVGLEIFNSLQYNQHFDLIGASSVDDHGKYVYTNYVGSLAYFNSDEFESQLHKIVIDYSIDAIYPTMDSVAIKIKELEKFLPCSVIGSSLDATYICGSKLRTYNILKSLVPIPFFLTDINEVKFFPVFVKPDIGYGSRNQLIAKNMEELILFLKNNSSTKFLFSEILPGIEFTVDCFTNRKGDLLFSKSRLRARITNGISVSTYEYFDHTAEITKYANSINNTLKLRGSWFFQMKLDENQTPKLLEVAARHAGSSSLFRAKGVNFPALTLYDHFDIDVVILENNYSVKLDRALSSKFEIDIAYENLYVDYDDCLICNAKVNTSALALIFQAISLGKNVFLITRHAGDLSHSLQGYRLNNIFDKVIHITNGDPKSKYIINRKSILIDDSFGERLEVSKTLGIAVFSTDMVSALLK
jgi:hypothetical protein